jgi:SAM-dependent methyltransferase
VVPKGVEDDSMPSNLRSQLAVLENESVGANSATNISWLQATAGGLSLLATSLAAFATLLIGRTLGADSFSRGALAVNFGFGAAVLFGGGLNTAAVRFGVSSPWQFALVRKSGVRSMFFAAATGSAAQAAFGQRALSLVFGAGALAAVTIALEITTTSYILGDRLRDVALAGSLGALLGLVIAGVMANVLQSSTSVVAFPLIVATASLVFLLKKAPPGSLLQIDGMQFRDFRTKAWLMSVLQTVMFRVDSVLLGVLAVPGDLGRYAVMVKAFDALGRVVQLRTSRLLGQCVGQPDRSAWVLISSQLPSLLATGFVLGAAGTLVFVLGATFVLGPSFGADRWWIVVLGFPYMVLVATSAVVAFFTSRGITNVQNRTSIISAAVSVTSYVALVPRYGLRGACIGSGVGYLVTSVILAVEFWRVRPTPNAPSQKSGPQVDGGQSRILCMSPHRLESHYQEKPSSYFSAEHKEVASFLPARIEHLLELGCGTGATSAFLKSTGQVVKATGMELSPSAADHARVVLDVVVVGDIEAEICNLEKGTFDVVLANDVLEHFVDPWSVVAALAPSLRTGGKIIARIPNARHVRLVIPLVIKGTFSYVDSGILDRTHLRFFTRSTCNQLFDPAVYNVESTRPYGMGVRPKIVNFLTFGIFRDFLTMHYVVTAEKRQHVTTSQH